ncbi:hypothetical protein V3C99_010740 [Haemonchus contortus]
MWRVWVAILSVAYLVDAQIRCKNMKRKDVDWFVALKLPASIDQKKGSSFAYFDPTQSGWIMSDQPINSTESAIGATVNQLYTTDDKTTFKITYNDECPNEKADSGRGHSKGVAVFSIDSGFWLVHSVPNFPPSKSYDYPTTGTRFAQSFLCLSLDASYLEDISQYMRYSHVTPCMSNLPKPFELIAPYLVDVVRKKSLSFDVKPTISRDLQTRSHKRARAFAKYKNFQKDLWHDFIALNLQTPMAVETWRNGNSPDVGTECGTGVNVYDVKSVKVLNKKYVNAMDHSKWGVSMKETIPAVCIGDINRQLSQFKRGGGAVCIEDMKLWKTFRQSVNSFEDCST